MAPQSFEYFFDLPPELREQILSHVCLFPSGVLVGGGVDGRSVALSPGSSAAASTGLLGRGRDEEEEEDAEEAEESADPPVNLFLASPVLYREAGDVYYGRNVFHFDFASASSGRRQQTRVFERVGAAAAAASSTSTSTGRGRAGQESRSGSSGSGSGAASGIGALARLLTHPETAGARRRIRSAVVYVKRFGALVLDVLVPTLGDMVLNGGLRRVRVDVLEAGTLLRAGVPIGSGDLKRVDYTENPALRALLVLLADPDMERAELRVPEGAHAWFWCRFHPGGVSEGEGRRVGCEFSGYQGGFLQVDVHRLVGACIGDAAELNIKKVEFG
ncbi:hypothetical protein NEMBOFW57_003244 [Staphylotrichum longicolle]|uniref:F-box domain-containing protein n=1 Tax=Staphylotrichum longicolle TaxID=669026 RepID=A0AAD4F9I9_9PEZI|nr:hypothetical protein NEMBOFW57_003244 [Staphylotrichum longicolle]